MEASKTVGNRVVIVGGNRGLGLEIARSFAALPIDADVVATCRSSNEHLDKADVKVIEDIDVSKNDVGDKLSSALRNLGWDYIDSVLVVSGILTTDSLDDIKTDKALKMYDIVALGPLRIVSGLLKSGMLRNGGKVGLITSEGGSIGLRGPKEGGSNYG
jgi:NAD(P)-dependent dehydrogenase (short-subunit alcohol dehydrogenase family)